ncbi:MULTISPECIES: polyribonucleotide nucleotidyltransferase [Thermodesulfovibrio]|uniref:Polyribonucleotide nucleotidyltransferase n=1 Tax=Thermodesulfovibrio yellowstonii (strain ATCC 51303 / DSM 11347 / YP87) TaxID=289376 RepID=PNP_THEYD|nr:MULTISPECIES: polyribonucleotide nucleotidyltransferase [Thermodesulfovibrio]B5YHN2.1 RecName: Full=Polyribonucleotide nucleotidyltransferase; AltName: Full=Polynucleotide phosphorylase; Short=PNPase [Thermodesulfovibrio yellowstonii DSM 11347]ACI21006.1 polyribonucleotide nucleotidyltransferase [Thermodesulfovibrio yellowstonii DSM 11347]MDI6865684.1 polyribonucleotide nucleotidyltransferase [Thermodesulfovibrio yellowstonii]
MEVELEIKGKKLVLQTGIFAKQTNGSVLAKYGDTYVLCTVVAEKTPKEGLDFVPLTIDYQEKAYSAGKIPGGFFKREGKPTDREILVSRLIDRPVRPLFPDGFNYETQGIASVLSYGDENIADILSIIGISSALTISDIPFNGPVAAVRVGMVEEEFILNPDNDEAEKSILNLVVAGTEEAVTMVEGGAAECSEETLVEALKFAHTHIKKIIALQKKLQQLSGKPKREIISLNGDEEIQKAILNIIGGKIENALFLPKKVERQQALDELLNECLQNLNTEEFRQKLYGNFDKDISLEITNAFDKVIKKFMRESIVKKGIRADGRKSDEIRPITCMIGILPRVHGSALFTRGETQALVATTLGTSEDEQKVDSLEGEIFKTFMLHYNFLPFSVGEVKPLRAPGRREIGHGYLAERALSYVIPSKDEFPYTIRVVSDILESNGSSSMATVCGATLSLMDAGVPIKAPVAGVAMGLIKEGDKTVVLTDILGMEDHYGDMDFKVAGTEKGITAFQMDVKISGISYEIFKKALKQAKQARLFILKKMAETISEPKKELSLYAPRIYKIQVKPEKIRDIIGTGGKVIKGIIEETGVKIDIEDKEGIVKIASSNESAAQKAIEIIKGITQEAELGRIYMGKVTRIVDFGAFVEIMPGVEGLLHISQIADKRIQKVSEVLKTGEQIPVKVIEIDELGRVRLSRKEALREIENRTATKT